MFDRNYEWAELTRFVSHAEPGPTLGVVSGRRRQGKTFLLSAACQAADGFYCAATEATEAESLHQFGSALARYLDEPVPRRFAVWDEAVETAMHLASHDRPVPVVLDALSDWQERRRPLSLRESSIAPRQALVCDR